MKYPYAVKANGKWYRPGEEVPNAKVEESPIVTNILLDGSEIQTDIPHVNEEQPELPADDEPKRRGRKPKS